MIQIEVIIEVGLLNREQKIKACQIVMAAGASRFGLMPQQALDILKGYKNMREFRRSPNET